MQAKNKPEGTKSASRSNQGAMSIDVYTDNTVLGNGLWRRRGTCCWEPGILDA